MMACYVNAYVYRCQSSQSGRRLCDENRKRRKEDQGEWWQESGAVLPRSEWKLHVPACHASLAGMLMHLVKKQSLGHSLPASRVTLNI